MTDRRRARFDWQRSRAAVLIVTVVTALILNRAFGIGIVAALIGGFLITAPAFGSYYASQRNRRDQT